VPVAEDSEDEAGSATVELDSAVGSPLEEDESELSRVSWVEHPSARIRSMPLAAAHASCGLKEDDINGSSVRAAST